MVRIMEVEGVSVDERCVGRSGAIWSIRVRIVWRGSSVSHDSIQSGVGSKAPWIEKAAVE